MTRSIAATLVFLAAQSASAAGAAEAPCNLREPNHGQNNTAERELAEADKAFKRGAFDEAVRYYQRAEEVPNGYLCWVPVVVGLGMAQRELGRDEDALKTFRRLTMKDLAPGAPSAWVTTFATVPAEIDRLLPQVKLTLDGPGKERARVFVDEHATGVDEWIRLEPGEHAYKVQLGEWTTERKLPARFRERLELPIRWAGVTFTVPEGATVTLDGRPLPAGEQRLLDIAEHDYAVSLGGFAEEKGRFTAKAGEARPIAPALRWAAWPPSEERGSAEERAFADGLAAAQREDWAAARAAFERSGDSGASLYDRAEIALEQQRDLEALELFAGIKIDTLGIPPLLVVRRSARIAALRKKLPVVALEMNEPDATVAALLGKHDDAESGQPLAPVKLNDELPTFAIAQAGRAETTPKALRVILDREGPVTFFLAKAGYERYAVTVTATVDHSPTVVLPPLHRKGYAVRNTGWAFLFIGAAALVAGGVTMAIGQEERQHIAADPTLCTADGGCSDDALQRLHGPDRMVGTATGLLIGGGVTMAAGLALYFIPYGLEKDVPAFVRPGARNELKLRLGLGSIALGGSFL